MVCGQSSDTITWSKLPQILIDTAKRLKMAYIENQPAVTLIKRYAFPEVLIYADPPYPLSTRSRRMYANEMTDEDHIQLLQALKQHPGPVLLSGYVCDLYAEQLEHWTMRTIKARAEGGKKRIECLWLNPCASRAQNQMTIF